MQLFEPGQSVGGFRLEELLHQGGTASLWRVTGDEASFPLVMKIPLLRPGENPITIVGFEVEQMILPRLSGIHAPRFVASGDFEMPYIVMERIDGRSLDARRGDLPLPSTRSPRSARRLRLRCTTFTAST